MNKIALLKAIVSVILETMGYGLAVFIGACLCAAGVIILELYRDIAIIFMTIICIIFAMIGIVVLITEIKDRYNKYKG